MQTSLIINTTDTNDKALQKTLTFVNANCPGSVLKTAAQMLNNLTTNTYVKASRIDKTDLATAVDKTVPSGSWRYRIGSNGTNVDISNPDQPINVDSTSFATANKILIIMVTLPTDFTSRFDSAVSSTVGTATRGYINYTPGVNRWEFAVNCSEGSAQTVTVNVMFAGTDIYLPVNQTLTFVVAGGE